MSSHSHAHPHSSHKENKSHNQPQKLLQLAVIATISLVLLSLGYFYLANQQVNLNGSSANIQMPSLITNCKFFYQVCPTSFQGVATNKSVQGVLNYVDSPLLQVLEVPYFLPNGEPIDPVPPPFAISYLAAEYNVNPFIMLTLSELFTNSVTQTPQLETPVDRQSEIKGFYHQYQNLARDLSEAAVEKGVSTESLELMADDSSLTYFNSQYAVSSDIPMATILLTDYFAKRANDKAQFELWLEQFPVVYAQLTGIKPDSNIFEPDERLSQY